LSYEVSKLIKESANQADLSLQWYVPEIVLHERRYQLINNANELLRAAKKLEKFIGRSAGIDSNAIEAKVEELIQKTITDNNLRLIELDTSRVDWPKMALDSAYRRPPFQPGEKEKGFRDALVAECYMQLLAKSPSDPKLCRVVLATNDGLLAEAIRSRINGWENAHSPCKMEEVKGLINTLISEVSEQFIERIRGAVDEFFFRPGAKDSVDHRFGKWGIV